MKIQWGAVADRLQEVISSTSVVPVASTDSNASTGLGARLGKLFGVGSTAPVAPEVQVESHAAVPDVPLLAETLDEKGLTPAQRLKFEELRVWRRQQSIDEGYGTKAFHILPDSTLINICMASPKTHEDLLAVSGIGPNKAGKYGEDILEIMNSIL